MSQQYCKSFVPSGLCGIRTGFPQGGTLSPSQTETRE